MIDASLSHLAQAQADERLILNAYKRLMRDCIGWTTRDERRGIRKAFEFAATAHNTQRRKTGEPYITHPLEVSRILVKDVGLLDATAVKCALLHDTVEDTYVSQEDIRREFGDEVAGIVEGLTKISGVFDLTTTSKQAENFRKMLMTMADDIRVALVKLADRLHNMRTLDSMQEQARLRLAAETEVVYAPLAHRFGLYNIKAELQDLALKYTEPEVYYSMVQKLSDTKAARDKYIAQFMKPIREKLQRFGIRAQIKHRVKSISSIYQKMRRQGIPFQEVYDLFAVRIILEADTDGQPANTALCWRVYNLVTNTYRPHPGRLRDWLSMPKASGYQSLHTTVMGPGGRWVEVQIRTQDMDDMAEKGVAAHWKYKDSGERMDEATENWLMKIRELLENKGLNARDFVQEVKRSLVSEEIFVFTPKGELKLLPQGATALDFAYAIHSRIGDKCIGAKVNHQVVPLNHMLRNGDQVEVITSEKQQPHDDWLQFVKTTRAATKIKEALKEQRKELAAKGKEIFDWRANQIGVHEQHPAVKELLADFRLPSMFDLYYQIGAHKIDVKRLSDFIKAKLARRDVYDLNPTPEAYAQHKQDEFEQFVQRTMGVDSDSLVLDRDAEFTNVTLAPCCSPIAGDSIIAFAEPDEGVVVHRTNCPTALELLSSVGSKVVKANWGSDNYVEFLASVKIMGHDSPGMLNKIIRVISLKRRKNLRSLTIDAQGGTFQGNIKFFVNNTEDLEKTLAALEEIRGIHSVTRVIE